MKKEFIVLYHGLTSLLGLIGDVGDHQDQYLFIAQHAY
jgi:hypothetical protein